jgi:hypothetical protein
MEWNPTSAPPRVLKAVASRSNVVATRSESTRYWPALQMQAGRRWFAYAVRAASSLGFHRVAEGVGGRAGDVTAQPFGDTNQATAGGAGLSRERCY